MRLLLTIQYLGTRYAGWQAQTNAVGIQQVLEKALSTMYNAPLRIEGAGRTDSGVHARAQRAHVDVPFVIASRGFVRGINNLLPEDIRIIAVETVDDAFHCRFQAKSKTYVYRIWNDEVLDVFAAATHTHMPQPLDETLMQASVWPLVGAHDFRALTVANPEVSSTVRTISRIDVTRQDKAVTITVTANGFLRFMVRRIAGSAIEIGRGKLAPDALQRSLEPEFAIARWTAEARGLTLMEIEYDG